MTNLVSATAIERIVGAPRHATEHIARAVSQEEQVYILHSRECLRSGVDLRECPFSLALDNGINVKQWTEDVPLVVDIVGRTSRLTPRTTIGSA